MELEISNFPTRAFTLGAGMERIMEDLNKTMPMLANVLPQGYKFKVETSLWKDEINKKAQKEKLDEAAWEALQKKHECSVTMDAGGLRLDSLIKKLITASSSPRVSWQNSQRAKYDSDAKLEAAFAIKNEFDFDLTGFVESSRAKMTEDEKLLKDFNKASEDAQVKLLMTKYGLSKEEAEKLAKNANK